jgi:hypothetical protein
MKEKIIKTFFKIAEVGTVIWSIWGMWQVITYHFPVKYLSENGVKFSATLSEKGVNILLPELLFYFLSAVLILYLLRKYERKN